MPYSTRCIPLELAVALSYDIGGAVWCGLVDQAGGGVWSVTDLCTIDLS